MLDILIIHPGNQAITYQELEDKGITSVSTPFWAPLLANYTRKKGYDTAILDTNIDGWDVSKIKDYNPKLVAVMVYGHQPSASTQTMAAATKIIREVKETHPDILVVTGGQHPSALPEQTVRETDADYVIKGEAVYTLEGLLQAQAGNGKFEDVPGLYFECEGEVVSTKPCKNVTDLDDTLDDYAWDLLPSFNKYRAHQHQCLQDFEKSTDPHFLDIRAPYAAFQASLGCPYACHYCMINDIFGGSGIRYWSVKKLVYWIERVVQQGVKNIRFDDELFILHPKRVHELCDILIERGYDLNMWVYARVTTIKKDLLAKMKKAGFNWVCLGIESGNLEVRDDVGKAKTAAERDNLSINDVVKMIQDHDIYLQGNYIFGLPEDTIETMQQTLDMAVGQNCEFINFYSAMAYPGSPLYRDAVATGLKLPDTWDGYSQHSYDCTPLPTKHISARDVLQFRDDAFHKYCDNPTYLNMVKDKFGQKARDHIVDMSKIRLKRKLLEDHTVMS